MREKNKELEPFKEWLLDEGVSERTAGTYCRVVASMQKRRSMMALIRNSETPKSTKTLYRSALVKWATFSGDDKLLEELSSPHTARMVKQGSRKLVRKVRPIPEEPMRKFVAALGRLKNADVDPWIWPVLSLFRKLALRAGVDLCQVRRDGVVEALETGVLQIWTKGDRVREVPARQVVEECERLLDLGEWEILADVISPAARPKTRQEAAYKRVCSYLRIVAEVAGMDPKEVHSHRFRHTRAMELYKKTKDIRMVQKFLGHKSVETTQRYLQIELGEIDDYLEELE